MEHLGSAHTDNELPILLSLAKDRLHAGQQALFPSTATALKVGVKQTFSGPLFKILKEHKNFGQGTKMRKSGFKDLGFIQIAQCSVLCVFSSSK